MAAAVAAAAAIVVSVAEVYVAVELEHPMGCH